MALSSNKPWKVRSGTIIHSHLEELPMKKPSLSSLYIHKTKKLSWKNGYNSDCVAKVRRRRKFSKSSSRRRVHKHPKTRFSPLLRPRAPHNTTSFIMRAKYYGGLVTNEDRSFGEEEEEEEDMGVDRYAPTNGPFHIKSGEEERVSRDRHHVHRDCSGVTSSQEVNSIDYLQGLGRIEKIDPSSSLVEAIPRSYNTQLGVSGSSGNRDVCLDARSSVQACSIANAAHQEGFIEDVEDENAALRARLLTTEDKVSALLKRVQQIEEDNNNLLAIKDELSAFCKRARQMEESNYRKLVVRKRETSICLNVVVQGLDKFDHVNIIMQELDECDNFNVV